MRSTCNPDGPQRRPRFVRLAIALCGVASLLGGEAFAQALPAESTEDPASVPAASLDSVPPAGIAAPAEGAPPAGIAAPAEDAAPGEPEVRGPDIPGYTPPSPPDPQLKIENELITQDDVEWMKRNSGTFRQAVNSADMSGSKRELVQRGFKILVLRLSLKANRTSLAEVRSEVERRMDTAGTFPGVKPAARSEFRRFMLDQILESARELIVGNPPEYGGGNLEVRHQAMILLNNAILEPENRGKRIPPEFYVPTYKTFLEVLEDHEQHDLLRIWAALGLRKVLLYGNDLRNPQRDEIAKALMNELLPGRNRPWLDMRIIEAAGDIDIVRFGGGKPVVVEGLCKVLNDSQRDCLVRSEAARQLGRIKVDGTYNLELFAHETAQLVRDMADEYAKTPKSAKWETCFANAYLAFVPENREEKNTRDAGFLVRANLPAFAKYKAYVEEAIDQIAPLVDQVVVKKGGPLDPQQVQALDTWLKSHRPTNWKPTPDLEPLEVKRVAETPPATPPAG